MQQIRDEILSGAFPPGAKLHVRDLSERLGLSISPVREALNQLAAQGIVQHSAQRGFTAPSANLDDLADLTLARTALNEATVRDAVLNGDAAWEEGILLAHHRLSRADRARGAAEWEALHRRFHMAIVEGCRSRRLVNYASQLFDMADWYRVISRLGANSPSRKVDDEHAGILRAALSRDADETVRLLNEHVERTDKLVRDALKKGT
jgi:DNA-binding GntR family transcriptional regulator